MSLLKRNRDRSGWSCVARCGAFGLAGVALCGVLLLICTRAQGLTHAPDASAITRNEEVRVRIGTYDSRAIAVAYGRSEAGMQRFKQLKQQHAEAEKAGDTKRVEQLKKQGEGLQVRLHLQTFSDGPVDEVIESVRAKLPDVAKKANVAGIVHTSDYHDAQSVELVDVTHELVALFNPDKQTLEVVKSLRQTKPQPIEDVARMPVVK